MSLQELYMSRARVTDRQVMVVTGVYKGVHSDTMPKEGDKITTWSPAFSAHSTTFVEPVATSVQINDHFRVGEARILVRFEGDRIWVA